MSNTRKSYDEVLEQVKAEFPDLKNADQKAKASEIYQAQKKEDKKEKETEEFKGITFNSKEDFEQAVLKLIKSQKVPAATKPAADEPEVYDEPKLFYTYDFAYTDMADRRGGKIVKPREPIRFEHSYRYNVSGTTQSAAKMVNLCVARVYAKDLVEYLRNHSKFGIQIFEDIRKVNAEDSYRSHVMVEVNQYVSRLSTHQLIDKAKATPGVEMDQDVDKVRHRLIKALADQEIANRSQLGKIRVKESVAALKTVKEMV